MATNNERDARLSSNTYGYTSRNYTSMTALAVNYFNRMASLSIHPPKDGRNATDYTAFDYDSGVTAYLPPKDCKLLVKRGRKAYKAFEETGEFKGFAVPLKRGLVEVILASELKKKLTASVSGDVNPNDIAIVVYTEMDDSKKTDKYLVHIFNEDIVITGYDPSTGTYETEREGVEFEYFLDALEQFADGMTNGAVHAFKDDAKYNRNKWERIAYELANNLGVDLSRSSNRSKPGVPWNNSNNNNKSDADRYVGGRDTGKYNAEMVNASESDVDAIIAEMNGSAD